MQSFFRLFACLSLLLAALAPSQAAHTTAELILSAETAKPGETILAGIHLTMEPEWHTYWRNPGGPGIPTSNTWTLPKGITAGEIQWPVPNKIEGLDVPSYGYEYEVVLIVPLTIAADIKLGKVEIGDRVEWLECKTTCIPGKAALKAPLTIGTETKDGDGAELIKTWEQKLPRPKGEVLASASWEKPRQADTRPLVVEWSSAQKPAKVDFYPFESTAYEVGSPVESLATDPGKLKLRVPIHRLTNSWPAELSGLLVQRSTNGVTAFEVTLSPKDTPGPNMTSATTSAAGSSLTLATVLLYAFLGGLILNIMPCVLPVIALKILGFVGEAKRHPARVRAFGLIYGLGVLVSFLVLAGFVIGLKAAGHKAGWGMQFSNPQFIIGMVVLVTLVALNLFGVFEVSAGSKLTDSAGEIASRGGAAGAFFNGVLATILGTPCTAGVLSLALGFAFAQPAGVILAVFATVAVGMAFPYVLLSWNPAWLKFVPKPGAWMARFKVAMGFPMLATAIWLLNLLPIHYGARSWWAGIFLVFMGFAAWAYGEFVQRTQTRRGIGLLVAIGLLLTGYAFALEHKLHWRSTGTMPSEPNSSGVHPEGLAWQPWTPEAVAAARAEQRPVIIDFTAQWCATCNTTVKPSLETDPVLKKLQSMNAVALIADYTKFPPIITEELARFQRAGVPLVVIYPKNPAAPPIPVPEPSLLTITPAAYSKVILKHLEEAEKM